MIIEYALAFPSPRGDKLLQKTKRPYLLSLWLFPSPRGDKLLRDNRGQSKGARGFRPLAGISCYTIQELEQARREVVSVPSRG